MVHIIQFILSRVIDMKETNKNDKPDIKNKYYELGWFSTKIKEVISRPDYFFFCIFQLSLYFCYALL